MKCTFGSGICIMYMFKCLWDDRVGRPDVFLIESGNLDGSGNGTNMRRKKKSSTDNLLLMAAAKWFILHKTRYYLFKKVFFYWSIICILAWRQWMSGKWVQINHSHHHSLANWYLSVRGFYFYVTTSLEMYIHMWIFRAINKHGLSQMACLPISWWFRMKRMCILLLLPRQMLDSIIFYHSLFVFFFKFNIALSVCVDVL